ncbi:glycoside hydrolase family 95 protein [uncultured Devosia sp.]|uniref:glycoside hydrolase family 95 protein n=1 Tax=uncultured Devosia sp. TaxID=211434 RepID=UPI002609E70C|nr:glycoside hydrolase family 95 protein [uncultured Devosia sp.]
MKNLELWYRSAATEWTEALPVGNGRLGAMVFGGVGREEIQFNEATLWSGGPYQPINRQALPNLPKVRELILAGRYAEAQALADQTAMAVPLTQMTYQPAGNLFIEFRHEATPGTYRRSLNLAEAVATTSYSLLGWGLGENAAIVQRESFASAADDVLVTRLSANRHEALTFEVWLDSPQPGNWREGDAARLHYFGTNSGLNGIEGRLTLGIGVELRVEGGVAKRRGRRLVVEGAAAATLIVDAATSFRRFDDVSGDPEALLAARRDAIAGKDYAQLRADHVARHQRQFGRLGIDLGEGRDDLPTNERIARFADGGDPALAALYLQYGRYLMLSSSRPGGQPANLQGIWNRETRPPWGSKYTSNINLEMNYWLPDPANLAECFEPLISLVEDLSVTGAEMAKAHYGARGWVLHHNTDLWRASGPVDGAEWGLWPTGGAWLCAQLFDHAAYAGYPEPLLRRLLPLIEGSVQFILDILQPLPDSDHLVTVPSISPENIHPHGAALCAGPTMDNQILRDLFDAYAGVCTRLGVEGMLTSEAKAARARLLPDRIGRAGQLQEWMEDWDMDVPEIHHRHVSHLYGLYPSLQIGTDTPDLMAAARKSLEIRGDDATGWGIGWRINLWARLRDGDHAHDVLALLLHPKRSYPNLFDAHPPFQIDGNFGGAAGILEMLVQSRPSEVTLLPALPSAWPQGALAGVRVRGGLELDFTWRNGRPVQVKLRSSRAQTVTVHWGQGSQTLAVEAHEEVSVTC